MSTGSDTTGHQKSRERPRRNPQALTGGRARRLPVRATSPRMPSALRRSRTSIRASALRPRGASGRVRKPPKVLGELRGLDVFILAAGRRQSVSALAVVLPRRDQTGLVCSNERLAIHCRRIDGRRSLWNHDPCSLSCHDPYSLARSPSRGGLVACPPGQLNRHVTGSVPRGRQPVAFHAGRCCHPVVDAIPEVA